MLAAGIILMILFFILERRVKYPLLDINLLVSNRVFSLSTTTL
ncbi:MAG: hypothetical protein R2727_03730 [Bacteroidales bacterium]